jgi:hypothetical protein
VIVCRILDGLTNVLLFLTSYIASASFSPDSILLILKHQRYITGVCRCVYGADVEPGEEIIDEICFYATYAGIRYYCRCKYAFSLEIGGKYRISVFDRRLYDALRDGANCVGRMLTEK